MKLGVRLHDLESGTIDQVIDKCHQYGFTNVQLVFKKALKDENGNPLLFNEKTAKLATKLPVRVDMYNRK